MWRRITLVGLLLTAMLAVIPASPSHARPSATRARMAAMIGVDPGRITEPTRVRSYDSAVEVVRDPSGALGAKGPRTCDDWYFLHKNVQYRFSHCARVYYVQTVAKALAELHLYYGSSGGWFDAPYVDSITINAWRIKRGGTWYDRAPQSRGYGPPEQDFYSAGLDAPCNTYFVSENRDESVRIFDGTPFLGPGGDAEIVTSPSTHRCQF
jgi:hypothetical protein